MKALAQRGKMIFLATTTEGLRQIIELTRSGEHYIWCGSDIISELDPAWGKVSRFNYPLKICDKDSLDDALETIKEHHPGQIILVEGL